MTSENRHSCPLCGAEEAKYLFTLASDRVVRCQSCALTYAISPPVAKSELYNAAYFTGGKESGGYQNYQSEMLSHTETFRRRLLDAERKLGRKGVLLDCGCAYGHLGHVARELGWEVYATDLVFDAVRSATQEYGLNGFVSDMDFPPLKPGSFDVITLYDVIEHIPTPLRLLRNLAPLLRPGGLLHITTPDVGSLSAHLLGRRWYHYKPREHLIYFSRPTLKNSLARAGFETLEMRSAPSHMTLHDILVRLRVYSRWIADIGLKFVNRFGLRDSVVKIHIGEMQAWARAALPVTDHVEGSQARRAARRPHRLAPSPLRPAAPVARSGGSSASALPVLNLLCCPSCGGDLRQETVRVHCESCPEIYEIRDGVPVLIPGLGHGSREKSA